MARVLVAMSGGVDSSVAAWLLKNQGHDCVGVTMLLHGTDACGVSSAYANTCCSLDDVEDAKAVARSLGIPHHSFDFTDDFERGVVDSFIHEYEAGRTPNPCVWCNRLLKFGALLRRARELGCDYLATGHYARVARTDGRLAIRRAADPSKDQSYFLCLLTQGQLGRILFPLGDMTKEETRALAAGQGLITARKRESQDVCFVPNGDYRRFLTMRRGADYPAGDILDMDGTVIGTHTGMVNYTIGQRKGIGLALKEPAYVCAKDAQANTVTVGPREALMSRSLVADHWNWMAQLPEPGESMQALVRVNYRHQGGMATVSPLEPEGPDGTPRVRIEFDEPQRAVTCGQFAVAYQDDLVLGGGTIRETFR